MKISLVTGSAIGSRVVNYSIAGSYKVIVREDHSGVFVDNIQAAAHFITGGADVFASIDILNVDHNDSVRDVIRSIGKMNCLKVPNKVLHAFSHHDQAKWIFNAPLFTSLKGTIRKMMSDVKITRAGKAAMFRDFNYA